VTSQMEKTSITAEENCIKAEDALRLMYELQKGKISGEQNGWLSEADVDKHFKGKFEAFQTN